MYSHKALLKIMTIAFPRLQPFLPGPNTTFLLVSVFFFSIESNLEIPWIWGVDPCFMAIKLWPNGASLRGGLLRLHGIFYNSKRCSLCLKPFKTEEEASPSYTSAPFLSGLSWFSLFPRVSFYQKLFIVS